MSDPAIALGIAGLVVAGTVALALYGVRNVRLDPEQFIVGGRSFGTVLLWVLMAGEIYTSFTFLGAAGWAYGFGAPAYYILAYGACAYVFGYFLLPAIWRVGKEGDLLTAPDFFVDRYASQGLGIFVATVQFVALVPYVTLQLRGLQLLLGIAGYGKINTAIAVAGAFAVIALFTFGAGLRGTAWASIVKDVMVLCAVLFAGIALPMRFFGSWTHTVDVVLARHPHFLTLPPVGATHGAVWYVSTVLLTSIGFFIAPQSMAATYSARSEQTLRRNAMLLPLYQVVMLLVFFAGLSALLIVPGLRGNQVDASFLLVVQRYYSPWMLGFVTAAGALAALIPASALLLSAASIFVKNVLGPCGVATGDRARVRATRILVLLVAVAALGFWFAQPRTLVELILLYYSAITQFAPGVVAALLWPRASAWGVAAGAVVGLGASVAAAGGATGPINAGFAALIANIVVMVAVSLLTPGTARPVKDARTRLS